MDITTIVFMFVLNGRVTKIEMPGMTACKRFLFQTGRDDPAARGSYCLNKSNGRVITFSDVRG